MAFVAQTADGSSIRYVDGKRYLWLVSLTGPLIPCVSVALYFLTGGNLLATVIPACLHLRARAACRRDHGRGHAQPARGSRAADGAATTITACCCTSRSCCCSRFLRRRLVHRHAVVALVVVPRADARLPGSAAVPALLLGHELGHKPSRADRVAAQVVNGLVGYGHFCIEHNRGHHVNVATPEDCVSARMGESIYSSCCARFPARCVAAGCWSASVWRSSGERSGRSATRCSRPGC